MMNTRKGAPAIGTTMLIVVAASVFLRKTSSERESLSPPRRVASQISSKIIPERVQGYPDSSWARDDKPPFPRIGIVTLGQAELHYWEKVGTLRKAPDTENQRSRVMVLTTEHLGLEGLEAAGFEQAAAQTTLEIRKAWEIRNEAIVVLPEWLNGEERAENERRIQDRYEAAKEEASGRVVSLLENNPLHDRFRQRLGEWIDAIR